MPDQQSCARCGQTHTRCTAHAKRYDPPRPCSRQPMDGQTVCDLHGGKSPQALATAARRSQEQKARAVMTALGIPEPAGNTNPNQVMLEAIAWKRAEVLWLRTRVQQLDENDLVWGITREKTGGDDAGTTREAKPNIWWSMLRTAEDQLVAFAAGARKAGVDDAMVKLAEDQGLMVATAVRRILDGIHDALVAAGVAIAADLWQRLVVEIVPRELRAIEGGGGA